MRKKIGRKTSYDSGIQSRLPRSSQLYGANQSRQLKEISLLLGQIGEKYFDYLVFNIVDYGVNCGLLRSGARRRALAQAIGIARGSTSTRPGVWKITLKSCNFVDISNTAIPTTFGGSTTTSPPIMVEILRQQLDYIYVYFDFDRADHAAPDKS
jgi:hypothetical protein